MPSNFHIKSETIVLWEVAHAAQNTFTKSPPPQKRGTISISFLPGMGYEYLHIPAAPFCEY